MSGMEVTCNGGAHHVAEVVQAAHDGGEAALLQTLQGVCRVL